MCFLPFSASHPLISLIKDLLAALKQDPTTASALTTHLPRLKSLYSKYCTGIPAAQALYERKLGERPFFEFENSFSHLNKPTLNYIMRPVQVTGTIENVWK